MSVNERAATRITQQPKKKRKTKKRTQERSPFALTSSQRLQGGKLKQILNYNSHGWINQASNWSDVQFGDR